ncbi:hypothetical protein ACFRKD_28200 [Streptomyces niveus]|uniref:hypothetical protein n=1 Tax=Streptomyces niveus TaxID=193462 RepID=UPI0036A9D0DF
MSAAKALVHSARSGRSASAARRARPAGAGSGGVSSASRNSRTWCETRQPPDRPVHSAANASAHAFSPCTESNDGWAARSTGTSSRAARSGIGPSSGRSGGVWTKPAETGTVSFSRQ